MTILRSLLVALIAAVAVFGYWASRHTIDAEAHDRYSRELRLMERLDARLNELLMKSRSGQLISYDPLASTLAELESVQRALSSPPRFVSAEGRAEVIGALSAFREALFKKAAALDDFETENAVLRNSLRFFPILAAELADLLHTERLVGGVLLFNLVPDRDLVERVGEEIERLQLEAERKGGFAEDADLELLIAHARAVLARKPVLDALTTMILSAPTGSLARTVDAAYTRHYRGAAGRSAVDRTILFLLALGIVLLAACDIIVRMRRSAAALRVATGEIQAANDALREEKDKERHRNEANSRFFLMTSHEVRKPLTVVMSSSELLEAYGSAWSEERRQEHFGKIRRAIQQMTSMFEDILLLGRAGVGILEHRPTAVDLDALCGRWVDEARLGAGPEHEVTYLRRGLAGSVVVDEKLLGSAIANLLSNAIKYSPKGGAVKLDVMVEEGQASFAVLDQGIGIPEQDRARLFGIFERANNVSKIPGSGLGLAIVKAALTAQKGSISVESMEGRGACFTVRVPCVVLPEAVPRDEVPLGAAAEARA